VATATEETEARAIPEEWKKVFDAAGIDKRILKDQAATRRLLLVISENIKKKKAGDNANEETTSPK